MVRLCIVAHKTQLVAVSVGRMYVEICFRVAKSSQCILSQFSYRFRMVWYSEQFIRYTLCGHTLAIKLLADVGMDGKMACKLTRNNTNSIDAQALLLPVCVTVGMLFCV